MNRFTFGEILLHGDEHSVVRQRKVKLYEGRSRTCYRCGELILTTHRLIWIRNKTWMHAEIILSLELEQIAKFEEEKITHNIFGHKKRLVLYLHTQSELPEPFIKLSAKRGITFSFRAALGEALIGRSWEYGPPTQHNFSPTPTEGRKISAEIEAETKVAKQLKVESEAIYDYCQCMILQIIEGIDIENANTPEEIQVEEETKVISAMDKIEEVLGVAMEIK